MILRFGKRIECAGNIHNLEIRYSIVLDVSV